MPHHSRPYHALVPSGDDDRRLTFEFICQVLVTSTSCIHRRIESEDDELLALSPTTVNLYETVARSSPGHPVATKSAILVLNLTTGFVPATSQLWRCRHAMDDGS